MFSSQKSTFALWGINDPQIMWNYRVEADERSFSAGCRTVVLLTTDVPKGQIDVSTYPPRRFTPLGYVETMKTQSSRHTPNSLDGQEEHLVLSRKEGSGVFCYDSSMRERELYF